MLNLLVKSIQVFFFLCYRCTSTKGYFKLLRMLITIKYADVIQIIYSEASTIVCVYIYIYPIKNKL